MITKTITSPAGETITLVRDDEWTATTGATPAGIRMWNAGNKRHVIAALWQHGEFTDAKGGATVRLAEWANEHYGMSITNSAITMMMGDALNALAFERNVNGKRTYGVKLVALPELWYAKLLHTLEHEIAYLGPEPEPEPTEDAPTTEPEPTVETPTDEEWQSITRELELDAPSLYEVGPPVEIEVAQSVAMALLTHVVEIISAGSPEQTDARVRSLSTDLEQMGQRYGQRLAENDGMRRKIRELGDEIVALRHERDGLRSRLRATESNLNEILKGDNARMVTQEVQKRIDQFMRQAPTSKKGEE